LAEAARAAADAAPKVSPVDLRGFVASQADAHGLRAAARAAGVSPTTLKDFIDGEVQVLKPETRRKFEIWYWKTGVNATATSDGGGEIAALRYLVRSLPEPERTAAAAEVLRAVEEAYGARRQRLPWAPQNVRAAFA
jgi:hypothetical protein